MLELPIELEREIFETAARTWRTDLPFFVSLMLVARRVHTWVEPIIYEISILRRQSLGRFLNLIGSKPAYFFLNVKAVCLVYATELSKAHRVLSACSDIRRLACWIDFVRKPQLPALIAVLPLRRLSIEFHHFVWLLQHYPSARWMENLTHLEFIHWVPPFETPPPPPPPFPSLASFPCLTHVALRWDGSFSPGGITTTLATCKYLQVLVIQCSSDEVVAVTSCTVEVARDRRMIVQSYAHSMMAQDWDWAYPGGLVDNWTWAEEEIAKRAVDMPASS
ncbi:hypothetical protein C8R44DRAFT_884814 [Mycena epipterygia]|nr:hypothetical protein C8R44DRAFT_884814 [Mycena epipterygia]